MFTVNQNQPTAVSGSPFSSGSTFGEPKTNKSALILVFGFVLLNVVAGGLVAYAFYMRSDYEAQNNAKKVDLQKVIFTPDIPLQEMQDFSGRIKAFSAIFNNAPSSYSLFTILEQAIIRGVVLKDVTAMRVEGTKSYKVTITGNAKSFQDLIAQRDIFRSSIYSKYVSNTDVTTYDLDPTNGGVKFTMTMQVSVGRFSTSNVIIDLDRPAKSTNKSTNTQFVEQPQSIIPPIVIPITSTTTTVKSEQSSSTKAKAGNTQAPLLERNNTI